jgi:hypothetical protein
VIAASSRQGFASYQPNNLPETILFPGKWHKLVYLLGRRESYIFAGRLLSEITCKMIHYL